MKKTKIAIAMMVGALFVAGHAKADPGIFSEPVNLDGSLDMRQSTVEQFDPVRGQSVADRPRPDFDAMPVSVGSFQFFPSLNVTNFMNTNIYATTSGEDTDDIWKFNPAFSLLSNWGRNALAFTGFGDFDLYTMHNSQNTNTGAFQAEGRWDIAHETWIDETADYQRVVELRNNPNVPGDALGPSEYSLYQNKLEAYRGLGLLKAKLDYDVGYYDYSPVELIGGGDLNQNDRNRYEHDTQGEVSYDITENFQPYMRGGYNWRNYTASNALNSSDGYNIDVGSHMDFGGVITAEAYMGYMHQNYYNFSDGAIPALDYGGDLLWNVTELTSLEWKAKRSFEETDEVPAFSILDSDFNFTATHELMRDLILEGHLQYDRLAYQNWVRQDDLYDAGFGGRYFVDRNIFMDGTYDYDRRASNVTGFTFNQHILLTRVGFQY